MLEAKILSDYRSIAMVGVSANPERLSYQVASYLIGAGYQVFPVNPNSGDILGRPGYLGLSSILEPVEVVNIFRRSEDLMPIADEAIRIGTKARNAGQLVIMNKCIREEHQRLREKVN